VSSACHRSESITKNQGPEASLVASQFEYRHRFWMIALVYVLAYAFYNLDHLNILYAIAPWNQHLILRDMLVRFLYAAAALLAACGAALLTWATAYRPLSAGEDGTTFSTGGPFRYVRNPHYLSYFFLLLALGTFQSRLGFPVMLLAETVLLLRLVVREELRLKQEYGERFRVFASTRNAFHAFCFRFTPAWNTRVSCRGGAKLSGTRHFSGALLPHCLPSR